MLKSQNTTKFISLTLLTVILAGCSAQSPRLGSAIPTTINALISAPLMAEVYLARAEISQDNEQRDINLLLAAHAYINEANFNAAQNLLEKMQSELTPIPTLQAEHQYLTARILAHTSTYHHAIHSINYPDSWSLPRWQRAAYYQFKAHLYELNKQPIEQVRNLSLLTRYAPSTEIKAINDQIWQVLQPMHGQTLLAFTQDANNPIFAGWLQLAYIAKHYAIDPAQLVRYLGEWQQQNPDHPAAKTLPADLEQALNAKPFTPKNIAVLLPLTGSHASSANIIRQGILSSYLTAPDAAVAINFYDTATDATRAYQQALNTGADFIIGPLLPAEITQLQKKYANNMLTKPVPQLLLNQTDKLSVNPNIFYFSLSPSQEAEEAAKRLHQDGIRLPLLLASNDAIGHRMAESFIARWLRDHNTEPEVHYYDGGDKMKTAVQIALGVRDSQARISRIKAILGSSVKADFRSRQDIDAIYMLSTQKDLTLLKAFIDVNFSVFTHPVPLYASSRSRIEDETAHTAKELNNLSISDAPWLMHHNAESIQVSSLWPKWNNSQKRLFIMGYDAIDLIGRLAQMRAFSGYQYSGRSGILSVDAEGIIQRQLSWGQYQNGSFKPL